MDVEVAMEYAVTVAMVLPWVVIGVLTKAAPDKTTANTMAPTVALAVEAPGTMESRDP